MKKKVLHCPRRVSFGRVSGGPAQVLTWSLVKLDHPSACHRKAVAVTWLDLGGSDLLKYWRWGLFLRGQGNSKREKLTEYKLRLKKPWTRLDGL